jgi:hypothetical protein
MTKRLNSKFPLMFMAIVTFVTLSLRSYAIPVVQEYYEIRIYHISSKDQGDRVDKFFKEAFLPALHRAGIAKIGVFKPVEADTAFGKLIYVFIPVKTLEKLSMLPELLKMDEVYNKSGKDFLDAPFDNPPYARYESILLKAFPLMPEYKAPSYTSTPDQRIYELRNYESATEEKAAKKIQMFNEGGEMKIFDQLGFNAVFFAQVIVGSHKPNLMYMTTFSDMKTHDEKWKAFQTHPDWIKLKAVPEYLNTVIKAKPYLLHPTSYSDF